MRIQMLVVALIATTSVVACSSGGGSSDSGSSNATGTAFKAVGTALTGVSGIIPNSATNFVGQIVPQYQPPQILAALNQGVTAPSNIWDGTGWMADPRCSGGGATHCSTGAVTLKYYMGFMFDANLQRDNGSDINVFGRVKSAIKHGCAVATVLGSSGLPAAGTYTVTFNDALNSTLKTYCFFTDSDLSGMSGTVATVTVANTTDTTYYDRLVTLSAGGQSSSMYMRVTDSQLNFQAGEANGGTNFSRITLSLNRTTNKLLAEYASLSTTGSGSGEWHRLFYDPANSVASMVGSSYDFQGSPNRIVFAVHGVPGSDTTDVGYSVGITGFGLTSVAGTADTSVLNYFKSCVSPANGNSTTDNSVTCASGTVVGHDVSGGGHLGAVYNTFVTALGGTNGTYLTSSTVVSETTTVPFTSATDIFTAAVPAAP